MSRTSSTHERLPAHITPLLYSCRIMPNHHSMLRKSYIVLARTKRLHESHCAQLHDIVQRNLESIACTIQVSKPVMSNCEVTSYCDCTLFQAKKQADSSLSCPSSNVRPQSLCITVIVKSVWGRKAVHGSLRAHILTQSSPTSPSSAGSPRRSPPGPQGDS